MENMENKKNNRGIFIVIIILLISLLFMGMYIIYTGTLSNSSDKPDTPSIKKWASKVDTKKDWIYQGEYETEVKEEFYETPDQKNYLKDIVVPYININSESAKKANREIENIFNQAISVYKKGIDNKLDYVYSNYKSTITDTFVSVILTYEENATDVMQKKYYPYTFSLETGDILSYKQAYEWVGFTKNTIEDKVKKSITDYLQLQFKEMNDENYPEGTNFDFYKEQSIKEYQTSVSNDTILFFIDANKDLNIIITYNMPVGRGTFQSILTVDK